CDCSSLTQMAYKAAGISLLRTTTQQYFGDGERYLTIPALTYPTLTNADLAQLAPGDLLYFDGGGPGGDPSHVGMYLGGDQMIHAPRTGKNVEIVSVFNGYHDKIYKGALRPWQPVK